MILIADSGSTKTDWYLTDGSDVKVQFMTQGINPFFLSIDEIADILHNELIPQLVVLAENIRSIYFYGSGCRQEMIPGLTDVLKRVFPSAMTVEVNGDLLAAARALCGRAEGIVCILGTGANSCLYDGRRIVMNTPPLGFILGDEGSGAVLGRNFVNAVFKGGVSDAMRDEFLKSSGLTLSDIIDKVYRQPLANRFLASLSPFIGAHIADGDVHRLVVDSFRAFFHRNVAAYGRKDLEIGAIGSVAFYYKEQLFEAAVIEGFRVGKIERSPIAGLVAYHVQMIS